MNGTIAGIDLGTDTGWCVLTASGERVASGTWKLRNKGDSAGARVRRLRASLAQLIEKYKPAVVFYELVHRHLGTDAAHLYGALQAGLVEVCEDKLTDYVGVSVQAVKLAATGKGNASKKEVEVAASNRWGKVSDNNEADALWVAESGRLEFRA